MSAGLWFVIGCALGAVFAGALVDWSASRVLRALAEVHAARIARIEALLDDPCAMWEPGLIYEYEIRRALEEWKPPRQWKGPRYRAWFKRQRELMAERRERR